MATIRITKKQLQEAAKAREVALEEDPEFRAAEEERERSEKEGLEQRKMEGGE